MSNHASEISFDTLEEALEFAREQKRLHPRSKKLNGEVFDQVEKKRYRI